MPPSRREELIEAAMKVFHRNGFHGTGLDKVLQEGGISRMTMYNHFKSKDELIVAALRRYDEIFRNNLMKFVDRQAVDPVERILAAFDYHMTWVTDKNFCGCMFISVAGEFSDPGCQIRRVAAEHKREIVRYLSELCQEAGIDDPGSLAEQLSMVIDGVIVTAQMVCQVETERINFVGAASLARKAAQTLIDSARG